MKKISPSFVGTTIATVIAALYIYLAHPGFHLWTGLERGLLLGGPVVVLITYTITSFIWENEFHITETVTSLGRWDYPLRVTSQVFLGLTLVSLGEDIKYYLISFMIFVSINTIISVSSRKTIGKLLRVDIFNIVICAAYTFLALQLYDLAAKFEETYPAFVADRVSYHVRVTQLRGEQTDLIVLMAFAVGAMLFNVLQVLSWPWGEQMAKAQAPAHGA